MLGLRDEVGGDVGGDRGVVGEDADLGRAGLGVDAAAALHQPLGSRDVDVARAGDDVDRRAPLDAVRQHRHGLRPADGPHLVDAEQRARRQHDRVRQAVGLRRARHGQALDAGDLRGDDVHDDAARVGDAAARHVEADPADGHPALGDGGALDDLDDLVVAQLRGADGAGPAGGLLESGAHRRVELLQRLREGGGRHPQVLELHAVEALGRLAHRGLAPVPDGLDDRPHLVHRGRHVERRPRQQRPRVGVAAATQVDAGQHGGTLRRSWVRGRPA